MKAPGRSLQVPPFLHGCAWHSSVSAQTGTALTRTGPPLPLPRMSQDSISPLVGSKALGALRWTRVLLGWFAAHFQHHLPSSSLFLSMPRAP